MQLRSISLEPPGTQQQACSSSQPKCSSRFCPEPISASTLAGVEARRRDALRRLGPCRSGCEELDEYVLLGGGFERGCVVGISAEDEDVGVVLGLQVLACSLMDREASRALVVTPKPSNALLMPLRNAIGAELVTRGVVDAAEVADKKRECLDRVMLSCVFDMDGLCEALGDLDKPSPREQEEEEEEEKGEKIPTSPADLSRLSAWENKEAIASPDGVLLIQNATSERPSAVSEIQDSQDEDEMICPSSSTARQAEGQQEHQEKDNPDPSNAPLPDAIIITHFSSLLTSLFTHREKTAAHGALQLLASRLRHLSRALPSNPLILILNSTDSSGASTEGYNYNSSTANPLAVVPVSSTKSHVDPTLRSIFNTHSHSDVNVHRRPNRTNKPSFGLVFTQLLELHLLCTRVLRDTRDADDSSVTANLRTVTVVEVLLDEIGVWEGKGGTRRRREQRWTAVDLRGGRVVSVLFGDKERGSANRNE